MEVMVMVMEAILEVMDTEEGNNMKEPEEA